MKRRPRKTTVLKLGVFLLLGAIVNVAVAWGSALLVDPVDPLFPNQLPAKRGFSYGSDYPPGTKLQVIDGIVNVKGNLASDYGTWQIRVFESASATLVESMWIDGDIDRGGRDVPSTAPHEVIPPWAAAAEAAKCGTTGQRHFRVIDARGWPFLSLLSVQVSDVPFQNNPSSASTLFGMALGEQRLSQRSYAFWFRRLLPLGPIWPGFAINTIFYAAILWLLWIAPGKIRRFVRTRQHRCPACAYFIAPGTCANGLCSECGARLPWMNTSTNQNADTPT